MSQQELLGLVVSALREAGIDYMLTGSIVSSLQGEPRATHDIDLVVEIPLGKLPRLLRFFPESRFYLSEAMAREAIAHESMFNLIDTQAGDKVDFWILKADPFDRSRFARRQLVSSFGLDLFVSTPEDTILMKLRWADLSGGSEKQFTDALRIYEVQSQGLDLDYLELWAGRLNIRPLLNRLREQAKLL